MKRTNILCALLLIVMLIPDVVMAQCPGTGTNGSNLRGQMYSFAPFPLGSNGLYQFIGTGGCTYMKFGPEQPVRCETARNTAVAFIRAGWDQYGTPATPNANGCTFTCDGGANVCQVRGGDGLPVELMEFSVEE